MAGDPADASGRASAEETAGHVLVVGVLPDVGPIGKVFDYAVPGHLAADVRVGTLVRVDLHGRRVGGWVVDGPRPAPAVGRPLRPVAKVTGWGPPPDLVDLARWAAWRWYGPVASFLRTASPPTAVRTLPSPPWLPAGDGSAPAAPTRGGGLGAGASSRPAAAPVSPTVVAAAPAGPTDVVAEAFSRRGAVLRLPPAADTFPIVAAAMARGPALVLTPSSADASLLAARLDRAGTRAALLPRDWALARAGGRSAIGARAAAWAPMPELAAVVVLDGHDEAYQEERAPTWHARDVAIERARRAGVPCVVVSPCPDAELLAWRPALAVARKSERDGWPVLDVVDRRGDDPRTGLFGERLALALQRAGRVVCVLNRKGRASLLACAACGELSRCEACGSSVDQRDDRLRCRRCAATRPVVCMACGATRAKVLRMGVSRAREELEALAGRPVGEVTAETGDVPPAPVLIGTEAVLHRAGRADVVAFLDFDQELLAPRYRAAEEALALLARAGRLVGGRAGGGRVLVQTRLPRHEVLLAALHGDPARLAAAEADQRETLGYPPARAIALVSGTAAAAFVEGLEGVEVLGPDDGRWLVRAASSRRLADALAAAPRPPGRLRVAVDPRRA